MKGSEFIFDSVDLQYNKCHKISLNRDGSYIDSPKWTKNKIATTNPKNNIQKMFSICCNCCFKLSNIKYNPGRIKKKLFIDQYNWKQITFP